MAPLPVHKFSSHDIVDIRPNKSATSNQTIASGVVYRVEEQCIIVALEDVPVEGLEQPLRLEKLANEVSLSMKLKIPMLSVNIRLSDYEQQLV